MPEPLLPVAIVAKTRSDEDTLAKNLGRLVAGDPTMRLERNAETHQLVLWCMGEAHADVVLDRLRCRRRRAGHRTGAGWPLRETFAAPSKGHGRHVKQSGGHGQYAVCDIEVEPLPRGAGFEFVDKVVGGAVPHQYIPSRGEGRAGPDGARPGRRPPGRRPTGHPGRRQGAQRRLLRRGVPDRRLARAAGGRRRWANVLLLEPVDEVAIRVPDDVRRRRHERPVRPPRPGVGHRARSHRYRARRWYGPRYRRRNWSGTPSNCVP